MKEQTYVNWEWIIWDDSDDSGRTAAMIKAHADHDHRLRCQARTAFWGDRGGKVQRVRPVAR